MDPLTALLSPPHHPTALQEAVTDLFCTEHPLLRPAVSGYTSLTRVAISPGLLRQSWFMPVSWQITTSTNFLPLHSPKCHLVDKLYGHPIDK